MLINLDVTMVSDTAEAGAKNSIKRSDSSTPSLCWWSLGNVYGFAQKAPEDGFMAVKGPDGYAMACWLALTSAAV